MRSSLNSLTPWFEADCEENPRSKWSDTGRFFLPAWEFLTLVEYGTKKNGPALLRRAGRNQV